MHTREIMSGTGVCPVRTNGRALNGFAFLRETGAYSSPIRMCNVCNPQRPRSGATDGINGGRFPHYESQ